MYSRFWSDQPAASQAVYILQKPPKPAKYNTTGHRHITDVFNMAIYIENIASSLEQSKRTTSKIK